MRKESKAGGGDEFACGSRTCQVLYVPCELNYMEFQNFYQENYEYGWIYPEFPQDDNLDSEKVMFGDKQTPEETEKSLNNLNAIKQRFQLEAIPQVVVLDKN